MNTQRLADITRRHFLSGTGISLGSLALSTLVGHDAGVGAFELQRLAASGYQNSLLGSYSVLQLRER